MNDRFGIFKRGKINTWTATEVAPGVEKIIGQETALLIIVNLSAPQAVICSTQRGIVQKTNLEKKIQGDNLDHQPE